MRGSGAMRGEGAGRWEMVAWWEAMQQPVGLEAQEGQNWRCRRSMRRGNTTAMRGRCANWWEAAAWGEATGHPARQEAQEAMLQGEAMTQWEVEALAASHLSEPPPLIALLPLVTPLYMPLLGGPAHEFLPDISFQENSCGNSPSQK